MDLREYVEAGDLHGAWDYVFDLMHRKRLELFRVELEDLVTLDYWWLSGELFTLLGEGGLGPGHRVDWDPEDLYPRPKRDFSRKLFEFLQILTCIPASNAVSDLIMNAHLGLTAATDAIRLGRLLDLHALYGHRVLWLLYDKIIEQMSCYEVGGARLYCSKGMEDDPGVGITGLFLIWTRGLVRSHVLANIVKARRFGSNRMDKKYVAI